MHASYFNTADGAELYWEEIGDGPRVLLVHGGTGSGTFDWEFVRAPLARSYRLLMVDLRGHGRSTRAGEWPAQLSAMVPIVSHRVRVRR